MTYFETMFPKQMKSSEKAEERYNAVTQAIVQDYDCFLRQLSEPIQTQFSQAMRHQLDTLSSAELPSFLSGFTLGAQLMLEALRPQK